MKRRMSTPIGAAAIAGITATPGAATTGMVAGVAIAAKAAKDEEGKAAGDEATGAITSGLAVGAIPNGGLASRLFSPVGAEPHPRLHLSFIMAAS